MAHYELHGLVLVGAWPGVSCPFYARFPGLHHAGVSGTAFFSPGSRYILSVVSMITFVVTKIAVGIYAGRCGLLDLAAEVQVRFGSTVSGSGP